MISGAGRSIGRRRSDGHRPLPIERFAHRIDHASQQTVSHRDVHHPPGALHFVARVQIFEGAQQDDADFILVDIERNALYTAGEPHQFFVFHARQAGHRRDTDGDVRDDAHFMRSQTRLKVFKSLTHGTEGAVHGILKNIHLAAGPASAELPVHIEQRAHLPVERCQIFRDTPANLLPVGRQFDSADPIRRRFEPDANFRGESFVERILNGGSLVGGHLEGALHDGRILRAPESRAQGFFRLAVHFAQTAREHCAYALLETVGGQVRKRLPRNRKDFIARGSRDLFAQPRLIVFQCSRLGGAETVRLFAGFIRSGDRAPS